jgi:acetyltransferase-like isoleucine patch superfamily enzyme
MDDLGPKFSLFQNNPNFIQVMEDYYFNTMIETANGIGFAPGVLVHTNNVIGRQTRISSGTTIFQNAIIGQFCSIGAGAQISLAEHPMNTLMYSTLQIKTKDYLQDEKPDDRITIIGNDTWIGINACIKRGVKIGNGVAIGTGAVVTKDVPDYTIVAGVPAKIIRYKYDDMNGIENPEEIRKSLLEFPWWNLPMEHIQNLRVHDLKQCIIDLRAIYEKFRSK